ncbi:hypothetical protein ESA94_20370 [Lacibacter luteus]|uniref:Phage morphogenesis protein n=1 Tax=Lacibacter luteus TaxID=2508719 RepID=A0A4Q1CDB7_9BACT|nr:hypothetical protein [Lacibacter luteus]RXK57556.1 hypothetical protein ESA94_20370 [Lacibacter luteus]
MTPEQFQTELKKKQTELKHYVNAVFPQRAGVISVRFVNGNFRAQGWQGRTFQRWKKNARKGTVLVKTGRGRRGTSFTTGVAQTRVYNDVLYMAVHNRGFSGTVKVKQHQRRIMGKEKQGTGRFSVKTRKERMKTVSVVKGISTVKEHTRKMNIPKRKFMPESMQDSPVLANALQREITRSLNKIFQ